MGKVELRNLLIRDESFFRKQQIEVLLATQVNEIDRSSHRLHLSDGSSLAYEKLALTTGARARTMRIPGAQLCGVVTLRSLSDAIAIAEMIPSARSVIVAGAGFIGLEVASALASLGKDITVVEAQTRVLARAVAPQMSDFLDRQHRRHGVKLIYRSTLSEIGGDGRRVRSVTCSDGTVLPADLVLVGIGADPNCELAEASGLECRNGIVVDKYAATADPAIVAAGDCTMHPNAYAENFARLESVQNANDQARTAAATLVGLRRPHDSVPWFWSDQYDIKLQMVGLAASADTTALRGSPEDNRFSQFHFRDGIVIAVDSVNSPGDHMVARKLVSGRVRLSPAEAADSGFDLKSITS